MGLLFRRAYEIEILDEDGNSLFLINSLRVAFSAKNTITRETNTADLRVYNLNPDNRRLLQTDGKYLLIYAGYDEDGAGEIFEGDIRTVDTERDGPDWITTITAGDGDKAKRSSRVNYSAKAGTDLVDAVAKIGESFTGLNVADALKKLKDADTPAERESLAYKVLQLLKGKSFAGKTEQIFDEAMRGMGKSWSIQKGKLEILGPTDFIGTDTIILDVTSGLIGAVEPGEKGRVSLQALLQPSLEVGVKIKLPTISSGEYRVEAVEHVGDTHGQEWVSRLEAKPF